MIMEVGKIHVFAELTELLLRDSHLVNVFVMRPFQDGSIRRQQNIMKCSTTVGAVETATVS